jgi:hypothetical protein
VCVMSMWTTAKLLAPAASPGSAPIDGGEVRYWRAPGLKLEQLRQESSEWLGGGEAVEDGERGGVLSFVQGTRYL